MIHIRLFEKGNHTDPLHEFDTNVVPQVGDILAIEQSSNRREYWKIISRLMRVDATEKAEREAVFYVALEVDDVGGSTTLTRAVG